MPLIPRVHSQGNQDNQGNSADQYHKTAELVQCHADTVCPIFCCANKELRGKTREKNINNDNNKGTFYGNYDV